MQISSDVYAAVDVSASSPDTRVDQVSFALRSGEILGVMGDAHSGADLLCRALGSRLRRREQASGSVCQPDPFSAQYVDFKDEFPGYLTVYEILNYCSRIRSTEWAIRDSVERFQLQDRCHVRCRDLSLYEQRLVALASKFPQLYTLVVLQDPTRGLDAQQADQMVRALAGLCKGGLRVVLTFDTLPVETACELNHLVYLRKGVPVYVGQDWKADLPAFLAGVEEGVKKSYFEMLRLAPLAGADRRLKLDCKVVSIAKAGVWRPNPSCCQHRRQLCFRYRAHIVRVRWHLLRQAHFVLLMGTLCLALFYHVPPSFATRHVHFVLMILGLQMWGSVALLPSLCQEEHLYREDRYQGRYSRCLYWATRSFWDTVVDVFSSALLTLLVCLPLRYSASIKGGVLFLLVWGIAVRIVSTRAVVVVSQLFCHSVTWSVAIAFALFAFQFLTSGIMAAPSSMAPVLNYVRATSFPTYALAAILLHLESNFPQQAQAVLAEYEIQPSDHDPLLNALYFSVGGYLLSLALRLKGEACAVGRL
jgi:ABC-type multidrug transport system ATPase subunit